MASAIQCRLTGAHETAPIDKFSYGVANRGCSVRIPRDTEDIDYEQMLGLARFWGASGLSHGAEHAHRDIASLAMLHDNARMAIQMCGTVNFSRSIQEVDIYLDGSSCPDRPFSSWAFAVAARGS